MARTMMALRKTKRARGAEMQEIPIPEIKQNEVLIKIHASSLCGTDVHIYEWDSWAQSRIKTVPYTVGHETTGEVVKAGSAVSRVKEGDIVSVETHIPCMHCKQCLTGQMHICHNVQILGVDRDGAFAEYLAVPEIVLWKNDASIAPEFLSIQEPLGNAVHATLIEPVHGKSVVILGDGPIGLFAVGVARAAGATKIFLTGLDEFRLKIGKKMGADHIIDVSKMDSVEFVKSQTDGIGADVVIEMSGATKSMQDGIAMLRRGGRYCFFGIFKDNLVPTPLNDIVFNGGTFYGINGRLMFDTWFTVSNMLSSGRLDVRPVVTHKMPLTDFAEAFELMIETPKKVGKIVLFPDTSFMK
ncbi:MAG: L-threonine 3-dehydrogenase [Candidatus Kapaibacterium sp.]|jgi:threonine 3-dehydrogenase